MNESELILEQEAIRKRQAEELQLLLNSLEERIAGTEKANAELKARLMAIERELGQI